MRESHDQTALLGLRFHAPSLSPNIRPSIMLCNFVKGDPLVRLRTLLGHPLVNWFTERAGVSLSLEVIDLRFA